MQIRTLNGASQPLRRHPQRRPTSGGVIAVPKAVRLAHVKENAAALDLELTDEELEVLDRAFPAQGVVPLETLS